MMDYNSFKNFLLHFPDFSFPDYISNLFIAFGFFYFIFFIAGCCIWIYAFYYCLKSEKDIDRRNIWLGIIIIGKITGALTYLTLEKWIKKKENI